jgi:hypothetical protein
VGGEVEDPLGSQLGEGLAEALGVPQVDLDDPQPIDPLEPPGVPSGANQAGDLVPVARQAPNQVGSDEAGRARDQRAASRGAQGDFSEGGLDGLLTIWSTM